MADHNKALPEMVLKVWNYLDDNSVVEEMLLNFNVEKIRIWRGHGTKAAKELFTSPNYFYKCTGQLITLGSLVMLKHGAYQSPTILQLIKPPDGKEYENMQTRSLTSDRLQAPSQYLRLQDSLTRAVNRIIALEQRVARLERHGR